MLSGLKFLKNQILVGGGEAEIVSFTKESKIYWTELIVRLTDNQWKSNITEEMITGMEMSIQSVSRKYGWHTGWRQRMSEGPELEDFGIALLL